MALVTGNPSRKDSILQVTPLAPIDATVNAVLVNSADFKSTFVDLKWEPRVNLLTHIEGSSWIVNYYSQVITTDSNLSGQQYTKNPVYQSYKLIKDMEMKVTSPLATSQDAETKAMTVTG